VLLGVRRTAGLVGIEGPIFFTGEVDSEEADLVDCCSHCFNRSATLPVTIGFGSGVGGAAVCVVGAGRVAFLAGSGGCDFCVGRTGVTRPAGGGPFISIDSDGRGRGGRGISEELAADPEVEASDLCLCISLMVDEEGVNDGLGASSDLTGRGGGSRRTAFDNADLGSFEIGELRRGSAGGMAPVGGLDELPDRGGRVGGGIRG
jgi:hypothetical protein